MSTITIIDRETIQVTFTEVERILDGTLSWGGIIGDIDDQTDLYAYITILVNHVANTSNPHAVTKNQVGLGNVDNTNDINKPISLLQQASLDLKADEADLDAHEADLANPHQVTKSQVGLANADNTADVDKPISTATQTALDAKQSTSGLAAAVRAVALTGLSLVTGTVIDAADTVLSAFGKLQKQISDNLTTLTSHTANTSNPHSVTKTQVGLSNVVNADTTTTANITDSSNKRFVTDAQQTVIGNTSGTNSGNETTTTIGSLINGATAKTTPVDADFLGLMDSAAANVLKKLSWANVKATIRTYFYGSTNWAWGLPPLVVGRRYVAATVDFQFADNGVVTANRYYFLPYFNREVHQYTKMGILVNVGINGAKVRMGAYADNGSNSPGALVYDTGELTCVGTGEQALDKTGNFTLDVGMYWLVFVSDSAITVQVSTSNTMDYAWLGKPDSLVSGVNGIRSYGNLTNNGVYGALAATAPVTTPSQSVAPVVQILA
jgi:hypothetical protein